MSSICTSICHCPIHVERAMSLREHAIENEKKAVARRKKKIISHTLTAISIVAMVGLIWELLGRDAGLFAAGVGLSLILLTIISFSAKWVAETTKLVQAQYNQSMSERCSSAQYEEAQELAQQHLEIREFMARVDKERDYLFVGEHVIIKQYVARKAELERMNDAISVL